MKVKLMFVKPGILATQKKEKESLEKRIQNKNLPDSALGLLVGS